MLQRLRHCRIAAKTFIPYAGDLAGCYFSKQPTRVAVAIVTGVESDQFRHARAPVRVISTRPASRHGTATGNETVLPAAIKHAAAMA